MFNYYAYSIITVGVIDWLTDWLIDWSVDQLIDWWETCREDLSNFYPGEIRIYSISFTGTYLANANYITPETGLSQGLDNDSVTIMGVSITDS